ncbi:hypothetical protein phiKDA1_21 (endogenous virus) [Enterobacter phage phiKDA1]|uniref:Uncharacterized protein n=1 Tax=Enterobacter phage phiKDA1 TaxID=1147139 RepID=A0A0A6Z567_9CAUD|nr:hypothetical protein HOQ86_gp22 [Enterobacter phage phiKDA1]AFE86114.1 hypothetical protein phiKDA1_21 [Enterobacter phage phiKDA1]
MTRYVVCYRCAYVYDWVTAPKTPTKRLKKPEPACPRCGCKVVYGG